jgi:hypothetical protein
MLLKCIINLEHNIFCQIKEIPLRMPILISMTELYSKEVHAVFINHENAS